MEADLWIRDHLDQPFSIHELAAALKVPRRTLQHAFQLERSSSPLTHGKRLRLQALRQALQDPQRRQLSIAQLMQQCGLLACGATAHSYQQCFAETPRQTRLQANA